MQIFTVLCPLHLLILNRNSFWCSIVVIVISEDERLEKPDGFVFERTIEIDRLFADVEIVLDNIYYDLNKAEIREDAKPALNQLVEILKEKVS